MTVAATATYVQYIRNGTTTQWSYPNKILAAADLVVTDLDQSVPPIVTPLVLGVDYTVQNVDVDTGCAITTTLPGTSGHTLDIRSSIARTQSTSIKNQGSFLPELHEDTFDRLTRLIQDITRKAYFFGVHGPDVESTPWPALPIAASRRGQALMFDPVTGLPTLGTPITQALTLGLLASFLNLSPTAAETAGNVVPANLSYATGNAFRYGADPTGNTDSTSALQSWINASWAGLLYGSPWPGAGGANLVPTLSSGRYQVSNYLLVPCNVTVTGTAHPANTESHTRIIQNSTGITPARVWSALTQIPNSGKTQAVPNNGYWYQANASFPAGVTGSTQPIWPTTIGATVVDGTVTWTCAALNTAGDNRNTPIMKFSRATSPTTYPNGGTLADSALNNTLQNLEFWGVVPGGTFNSPLSGASNQIGDYPLGGAILYDVTCVDHRVVSCVFQNMPCALRMHNVPAASALQGDGFTQGGVVGAFYEECEFDAAGAHIWADNCNLDLVFKNCAFYGGVHKYTGCTGRVVYENCRFYGGAYIDASDPTNNFTIFSVDGGELDLAAQFDSISIYKAVTTNVKSISFTGSSGKSAIVVNFASTGVIANNNINDSGFNAAVGTGPADYVAAIKLIDCFNVLVAHNNITGIDAAAYNGFGILTCIVARNSISNFITGNAVTAAYSGAVLANGQQRYINLSNADIRGQNYESRNTGSSIRGGPYAVQALSIAFAATMTPDCSQALEFDIVATSNIAFTIANPLTPILGMIMWLFIKNTSGGTLGTITFGSAYKMLAYSSPINGGSSAISFRYDGTNWVQFTPQTVSVPN